MTEKPPRVNPTVKCVVNTCNHYFPGDKCVAANIDILNQNVGDMSREASQTMCKSFSERSSIPNYLGSLDNKNWGGLVSALMPGQQITPTVTCVVNSCKYWDQGDVCIADTIAITGREAKECQQTDCETFEKRE
ncbi:MAG TPA: DUF1540 domain-containing protein [Clostridia bacterium]|jgi:hypothetical protein|nr:DUF1540 domain-containing protein [Clostridia bacterium]